MHTIKNTRHIKFEKEYVHSGMFKLTAFVDKGEGFSLWNYWYVGPRNEILWGASDKELMHLILLTQNDEPI